MTQHNVLDADRIEYNRVLEQAFHASQEMDPKLPMFFYVLKDGNLMRQLIAIVSFTFFYSSVVSTLPPLLDRCCTGAAKPHYQRDPKVHITHDYAQKHR